MTQSWMQTIVFLLKTISNKTPTLPLIRKHRNFALSSILFIKTSFHKLQTISIFAKEKI